MALYLDQYKSFLKVAKKDSELEFQNCTQRVDTFYIHTSKTRKLEGLWCVFKLLLTLCHSQSAVERDSMSTVIQLLQTIGMKLL